MSAVKEPPCQFRVGDWVSLSYGAREVSAEILEDRGPIGVRGRRLYRIQLAVSGGNPDEESIVFEMPEDELAKVTPPFRRIYLVKYTRQGRTNDWLATTKPDRLLKGVDGLGVAEYSDHPRLKEDGFEFPRTIVISVLVELGPQQGGLNPVPGDQTDEIEFARSAADAAFLATHRRARITHDPKRPPGDGGFDLER